MARKKQYDDTSPNPFSVKIGQIWEDLDSRQGKRVVIVLLVREDYGFALVKRVGSSDRTFRVKLTRFRPRSNGYKLVKDSK